MQRLVLLGGGHAHVHCLDDFAARPLADVSITLVSPYPRQIYSGMLPGWVAGHYAIGECAIPLPPLAARAGAAFRQTRACGIDAERRVVRCEDGTELAYDVLSIDTGPVADLDSLPGAQEHALPVRPIEDFVQRWPAVASALGTAATGRLVMVGAGAAGVELALAARHAMRNSPGVEVLVLSASDTLPGRSGPRLERLLREAGIALRTGAVAARVAARRVIMASGDALDADAIIVSTGAAPAPWLTRSGLPLDERGFLRTDAGLRAHERIFAAGDCATIAAAPRPRSGVYAVRAGPPLAANIRRALTGLPLRDYRPQRRALYLVSAGARFAVGVWNGLAWEGAWVWHWKDRIDRSFVRRYSRGP